MNNPSSPTPPPSPESLPSSSDDCHDIPRENISDFSEVSPSVPGTSPFSSAMSSISSSMANASMEPTSSTSSFSVPLMSSQDGLGPANGEAMVEESSNHSIDCFPVAFPASLDQCPSSSKSKLDSAATFQSSCSPNPFSSEVSSSNMDVDMPPFSSSNHVNSVDNEAGCEWPADSSEGAAIPSFSHATQDIPPSAVGETMVSRSTWQVNCSKNNTKSESSSSHWTSEVYHGSAGTNDVSSTGSPESHKHSDRSSCRSRWASEESDIHVGEPTASTSSCPRDPVNSSLDVESSSTSWCQESSEGAVGLSWQCDSPNSAAMGPSISPSSSSTAIGASLSLSPWPPPLSSNGHSGASAGISSSTQHYPNNPNINSTSVPHGDIPPQVLSWRTRASSSPISLTRVAPTTPPPRPPTPPCPATPSSRHRAAHNQYPPSPRRSVSPQDRLHSPSTVRRSVSPPLRHHSRSTPPTPSRRSVSPPLRSRGLTQRLASPRRSVSPISLNQPLAQPPSPSGRHRLSPRPRSARTPSPRPPRPPNSTPEPSPSPSQHSPRPHHAKMRGR
ncbi:uncharacterized protein [Macrobrachium rosenbergii]|uniref:uncharacterized protein isoform X1 n=2 Tax=Macrobrachium rosenbergii TaxID=79674 RepID=UPI0034D788F7